MDATVLLLADGRFPSGGHAHSGGLEAAVAAGRVRDVDSLAGFLRGRLATTGLVAAAFAAAACAGQSTVDELEAGLDARTPSGVMRDSGRRQGRALLRAARQIWGAVPVANLYHPVALGVVAAAAGLAPAEAALAAVYGAVAGPASAAVRLLGLDPFAVHRVLADLAAECDRIAAAGASFASAPVARLPAAGAPLLDISAEEHARWEVRLFAS
jgi:urease accessory protein